MEVEKRRHIQNGKRGKVKIGFHVEERKEDEKVEERGEYLM